MKDRFRAICVAAPLLLQACCCSFPVRLDPSDILVYGSGGGELGALWVEVVVHGSSSATYRRTEAGSENSAEVQVGRDEVGRLFQDLVGLGLFCMRGGLHGGGADVPATKIEARIDGRETAVAFVGPREADDASRISQIEARTHPFIQEVLQGESE